MYTSNYQSFDVYIPNKGPKTSEELKNGPIPERRCTNLFCLILFIIFWGVTIYFSLDFFNNGHPERIIAPYDYNGNPCGLDAQEAYPFLFWYRSSGMLIPNHTVCVKTCPTKQTDTLNCSPSAYFDCNEAVLYETIPFGDRLCMPKDSRILSNLTAQGTFMIKAIDNGAADLKTSWYVILIISAVTCFSGFLYLIFMRHCAGVVTWILLIAYFVALVGLGLICYGKVTAFDVTIDISSLGSKVLSNINEKTRHVIAYVPWGFAVLSLIIIGGFSDRIKLAVAILKCASEFVRETSTILFVPFVVFIISVAFYIFWAFSAIYLIASNPIQAPQNHTPFADVDWTDQNIGLGIFFLFGLAWNHALFTAMSQFIVASACCFWYFCRHSRNKPDSPVLTSLTRGLFRHIGSLALGSAIIGLLDTLRMIMLYFESQMKLGRQDGAESFIQRYCIACVNCCLDCFERFVKMINEHAYIHIAMTGDDFYKACEESFSLMMRNSVRFGFVHGIGSVFSFIGQVFITFVGTLVGYLFLTNSEYLQTHLFTTSVPLFIFFLLSAAVGQIFMSVYGTAADTILHCYCMDEEINEKRVKFAPGSLVNFVNEYVH